MHTRRLLLYNLSLKKIVIVVIFSRSIATNEVLLVSNATRYCTFKLHYPYHIALFSMMRPLVIGSTHIYYHNVVGLPHTTQYIASRESCCGSSTLCSVWHPHCATEGRLAIVPRL